jgi:hypothetical protein
MQRNVPDEIRELHRRVLALDLTLEQIGERIEAHRSAVIKQEQSEAERLRRMLTAMPAASKEGCTV